jgi:glycerol kinase
MVDDLELIPDSQSCGKIASTVENNGGVYIVPAFVGLGAPYWDSEAKATITGITRGSKKAHIVRAAEESIAYQIKDVLDLMIKEADIKLQELRVDGGPAKDNFLMQFQADILNVQVVRTKIQELSALGTAYMAGLKIGLWKDINTIKSLRMQDLSFIVAMNEDTRNKLYAGWKEAVKRTLTNYLSIK